MQFLHIVLIKEIPSSFQSIFLVLSHIMKIVKNSEARLVINLRIYKNAEEKNAEQKMRNGRMHIYPKFKIFNLAFF